MSDRAIDSCHSSMCEGSENLGTQICMRQTLLGRSPENVRDLILDPFMIHELLPSLTETAFGSHPRRVFSVSYG